MRDVLDLKMEEEINIVVLMLQELLREDLSEEDIINILRLIIKLRKCKSNG